MISVRGVGRGSRVEAGGAAVPALSPPAPKMLNSAIVQAVEAADDVVAGSRCTMVVPVDMATLSPVEVAVPVKVQLAMLVIGWLGTEHGVGAVLVAIEVPGREPGSSSGPWGRSRCS